MPLKPWTRNKKMSPIPIAKAKRMDVGIFGTGTVKMDFRHRDSKNGNNP